MLNLLNVWKKIQYLARRFCEWPDQSRILGRWVNGSTAKSLIQCRQEFRVGILGFFNTSTTLQLFIYLIENLYHDKKIILKICLSNCNLNRPKSILFHAWFKPNMISDQTFCAETNTQMPLKNKTTWQTLSNCDKHIEKKGSCGFKSTPHPLIEMMKQNSELAGWSQTT